MKTMKLEMMTQSDRRQYVFLVEKLRELLPLLFEPYVGDKKLALKGLDRESVETMIVGIDFHKNQLEKKYASK